MRKEKFVEYHQDSIIEWLKNHRRKILYYMKPGKYIWKGKSKEARDDLEKAIKLSRQKNCGGIDLETANKIYMWGFGTRFCLQNGKKVKETTRRAFDFLDRGDCYHAAKILMPISWKTPHPAGATKILGLSDQSKFCIYDSRVGNALKDLKKNGRKIILCPSGRGRKGDPVPREGAYHVWAENYQKLIWTLEIIREYLKGELQYPPRIADIEMALFMIGKTTGASTHAFYM